MNRNKKFSEKQLNTIYVFMGFVCSVCLLFPYFILREGSIVAYHDQLDGELIGYLLAAKYLFSGTAIYPEMMNGIPVTGAVAPAISFVLIYKIMPAFTGFIFSQWLISIVCFCGMYLLVKKLGNGSFNAFVCGIIFMILPFYPVYGLCIPGQPLLIYSILCLNSEKRFYRRLLYYGYILVYALSSSLVLVGFAVLIFVGFYALYKTISDLRREKKIPFSPWLSLAILISGYILCNISLIRQVINPEEGMTSHKAEIVYSPTLFWAVVKRNIYPGEVYTEAWPVGTIILLGIVVVLMAVGLIKKNHINNVMKSFVRAIVCLGFIFLCACWSGLYFGEMFTNIRNSIGGAIKSFNLSRIVWLTTPVWVIAYSYLIKAVSDFFDESGKKLGRLFKYSIVIACSLVWGVVILLNSPVKVNVSKIIKGDNYYALDWEKFYATDIFDQIDKEIGLPKENYKVVSLGIYPAAAQFNGYYCLDGYSNNYPLSYKHEFREVFADELAKSDYIREYFDNWGNRCYIITAEYNNYFEIERKWNGGFHNLKINTRKLKEMGCSYIFSATWIENAEELNLTLLRDEPFVSDKSWYNIYVYKIN